MKKIMTICIIASTLLLGSCGGNNNGINGQDGDKLNQNLVAEVGYAYTIPQLEFSNAKDKIVYTVYAPSGKIISLDEQQSFTPDKVGTYIVQYASGELKIKQNIFVTDTEKPRFEQFWYDYSPEMHDIQGRVGQELDLREIIKAHDNSGSCNITYKLEKGGVKPIELIDGSKFTVETSDYYYVYATAADNYGNTATARYRLEVNELGMLLNFNFGVADIPYFAFYGSYDYDQYASYSEELRKNIGFDNEIKVGKAGYSFRANLHANLQENREYYMHFSKLNIDFSAVAKLKYKVFIEENENLPNGTILLNSEAVPHINGVASCATATVGEWSEITVDMNEYPLTNILQIVARNTPTGNFPGGIDYSFNLDDFYVEYKPIINNLPKDVSATRNTIIDLDSFAITGVDVDTGEILPVKFEVRNAAGSVAVIDNTFTLQNFGTYYISVIVESAKGNTTISEFKIITT